MVNEAGIRVQTCHGKGAPEETQASIRVLFGAEWGVFFLTTDVFRVERRGKYFQFLV